MLGVQGLRMISWVRRVNEARGFDEIKLLRGDFSWCSAADPGCAVRRRWSQQRRILSPRHDSDNSWKGPKYLLKLHLKPKNPYLPRPRRHESVRRLNALARKLSHRSAADEPEVLVSKWVEEVHLGRFGVVGGDAELDDLETGQAGRHGKDLHKVKFKIKKFENCVFWP